MDNFPEDLKYTSEHEWCRVEGTTATIGITWHAQDQLGDVVYCEIPEAGEDITAGSPYGVVESVKAVSDLVAPVTGKVLERNGSVIESPEGLNEDMYGDAWLIKIEISNPAELDELLDRDAYVKLIEEEAD